MTSTRPTLALTASVAAPAAALVWLGRVGGGALAPPPVLAPARLAGWAAGRDPAAAVMAAVRLGAVAACWYLLGVVALGVCARLSCLPAAIRVADVLTVAPVRAVLHGALGAGVVLAAWAGPATAAGAAAPPDPPVLRRLDSPPTTAAVAEQDSGPADPLADAPADDQPDASHDQPDAANGADAPADDPGTDPPASVSGGDVPTPPSSAPNADPATAPGQAGPDARSAPPSPTAPSPTAPSPTTPSPGNAAPRPAPPPSTPAPGAWTVRPGDSFWRIAAQVLAAQRPTPPSEQEVGAYWERLVAANRDRLRHSGNANLIYAGQEFVVPPP